MKAQDISRGFGMVKLIKKNKQRKKTSITVWKKATQVSMRGEGALALNMQLEKIELAAALQELV